MVTQRHGKTMRIIANKGFKMALWWQLKARKLTTCSNYVYLLIAMRMKRSVKTRTFKLYFMEYICDNV
jgi:hypothetical protein